MTLVHVNTSTTSTKLSHIINDYFRTIFEEYYRKVVGPHLVNLSNKNNTNRYTF